MKKAMLIALPFCLVLLICPMGCRPLEQGSSSLLLGAPGSEVKEKTIAPFFDGEIAYYDVHGNGPDLNAFSLPGVTGSTVVENSLAAGSWTITADAFNANQEPIGSGSVIVTIEAGKLASEWVQVAPLIGTGSLSIAISWPSGAITVPALSGTLTSVGGTPQTLSFSMGADSASCDLSDLDARYYSFTIQLSDGAVVVWGSFEAVRILKGLTTTASFGLEAQDLLSGT